MAAVIRLRGATSGYTEITVPDVAADNAIELPQSGTVLASQEYVDASTPSTIDDIGDVDSSSATDGDVLTYNSTSGNWEAKPSLHPFFLMGA